VQAEVIDHRPASGHLRAVRPRLTHLPLFAALIATPACAQLRQLTDADLTAYAAKPYDKAAMMEQTVTLGTHHGVTVVVDFPCSDVCPNYTTRIIHYGIGPGPACTAAGGVSVIREVPYSIAVVEKEFCVPKVVAGAR
jgi:hypothetical protein